MPPWFSCFFTLHQNLENEAYHILLLLSVIISQFHAHAQKQMKIVATSSWTAAYAQLAGLTNIQVLAPFDMHHPTEYELQIEDIKKLKDADLIICGGYEIMMDKIRKGLQIDPERILQIKTDYNLDHITKSARTIPDFSGTSDEAEKNLINLANVFKGSGQRIKNAGISQILVLV